MMTQLETDEAARRRLGDLYEAQGLTGGTMRRVWLWLSTLLVWPRKAAKAAITIVAQPMPAPLPLPQDTVVHWRLARQITDERHGPCRVIVAQARGSGLMPGFIMRVETARASGLDIWECRTRDRRRLHVFGASRDALAAGRAVVAREINEVTVATQSINKEGDDENPKPA